MKPRCLLTIFAALALAGCQTSSPQVQERVISVPSSKPYRFIKFTDKDQPSTIRQIKKHNATHAAVKRKEREAKVNQQTQ